jgi:(E)-2-((N-methylformamido)methylene)succinate hydrolase
VTTERVAKRHGSPAIRYVIDGQGPWVTLVHGVGANLESWDEVVARLASAFTCLRLDLRGHGGSEPITGACALDDLAADVRLVWDEAGVARSHLAGFSLGGLIAQALALSDGERIDRLAIISAVAGRTEEERAKVENRLELLRTEGIAAIIAAAEERWFTPEFRAAHPERVERRLAELLANDPTSYAAAYTVFARSDLGYRVHEITHPTLVATGENDVGSNVRMARMMHERIGGSTLHILPGLRHSVLVEASDQIAGLLGDFFGASSQQPRTAA